MPAQNIQYYYGNEEALKKGKDDDSKTDENSEEDCIKYPDGENPFSLSLKSDRTKIFHYFLSKLVKTSGDVDSDQHFTEVVASNGLLSVDLADTDGSTPFYIAAKKGNLSAVQASHPSLFGGGCMMVQAHTRPPAAPPAGRQAFLRGLGRSRAQPAK